MIKLLIAFNIVALSGCGRIDRWWAGTTGKPVETCYQGVVYLQFTSGSTVAVDSTGKPLTCR